MKAAYFKPLFSFIGALLIIAGCGMSLESNGHHILTVTFAKPVTTESIHSALEAAKWNTVTTVASVNDIRTQYAITFTQDLLSFKGVMEEFKKTKKTKLTDSFIRAMNAAFPDNHVTVDRMIFDGTGKERREHNFTRRQHNAARKREMRNRNSACAL